jgi:hypothetical protein
VLWGFWEGCEEAVVFIFMIISGRVDVLLDSNSDELVVNRVVVTVRLGS